MDHIQFAIIRLPSAFWHLHICTLMQESESIDVYLRLVQVQYYKFLSNWDWHKSIQIVSNRQKSIQVDFVVQKSSRANLSLAHIKSVFRIFVSSVFVLQKLPESISADLKRFELICVSLNSTEICSTVFANRTPLNTVTGANVLCKFTTCMVQYLNHTCIYEVLVRYGTRVQVMYLSYTGIV